jgi:hypothetical protein
MAKAITQVVETAYDIESEASYSFDLSSFSSVFVNEPHYILKSDTLEFINKSVGILSLETSGYLDYKIAYYNWWKEGLTQFDELREKAITENRNMTDEELNTFLSSKWGNIPGRIKDPGRHFKIKFVSINVDNNFATVVFSIGSKTNELYLVLVNGQWYIAGDKENTLFIETPSPTLTPAELPTETPTELPTQTPTPTETVTPTP